MELQVNLENISISTEKVISKINNLINDWAPLKNYQIPNKNYRISHTLQKGFLSPLRTKISNIKKYVKLNTLLSTKKIEQEFKTYKYNLIKLTRTTVASLSSLQ